MGQVLLLFAVLCSVLCCAWTAFDITKKRAIVRRFGQCQGAKALPVVYHDVIIAHDEESGDMTLTAKISVLKEISGNFAIVLSFWRCDASGNPDSCEYILKDYNATNVCELISAKDEIWTIFISHLDMPPKCPIKVGEYTLSKIVITPDILKYMPVSDALWKVRLTGWDTGIYISCVELEEQIVASYNRRRNRKNITLFPKHSK